MNISTHFIFSHNLSDNASCSRSLLYLSPIKLLQSSLFILQSIPFFLNPASWLSSTFNTSHLSHFTTNNLINPFPLATPSTLFHHPKFRGFVQQKPGVIPDISNSIVDPLHPIPEPSYFSCSGMFDEWFGIPFKDTNCFTNFCSPHPYEKLRLYVLSCLIPLHPCIFPTSQIRTLVLHVLPLRVSHHIVKTFLSDAVPPSIHPPTHL